MSLKLRDSSPIVIQAGYDGGFNGAWFEFRKDGTYKFVNNGGVGATIFRGKYQLKDSIIYLDKSNIDGAITSNKLAIRELVINRPDISGKIVQIDEKHKTIDRNVVFIIHQYDFGTQ